MPGTSAVRIEAGVTQGDLYKAIVARGLPYLVPTTGAGPNGNLIGNALDGGYGATPWTDHMDALFELEGVWGSGAPFRHSYSDMRCPDIAAVWRNGLGPVWQGLLHQSGFGVVTKATLQLAERPESSRLVIMEFANEADFMQALPAMRKLMTDIPGLSNVLFNSRLRACATQENTYFRNLRGLAPRDRAQTIDALFAKKGFRPWIGLGFLYGGRDSVQGSVQDIRRRLPTAKVKSLSPRMIQLAACLGRLLPKGYSLKGKLGTLVQAGAILEGVPTPHFLSLAYVLKCPSTVTNTASNPATDGCGLLWYAPILPIDSKVVTEFLEGTVTEILNRYGFDALIGVTLRNGSAMTATMPLLFNKDDLREVSRANVCYEELLSAGLTAGYPPYRLGVEHMEALHRMPVNYPGGTWQTLKRALDPNRVLSNGRYVR